MMPNILFDDVAVTSQYHLPDETPIVAAITGVLEAPTL
jgi:hypothetical protein